VIEVLFLVADVQPGAEACHGLHVREAEAVRGPEQGARARASHEGQPGGLRIKRTFGSYSENMNSVPVPTVLGTDNFFLRNFFSLELSANCGVLSRVWNPHSFHAVLDADPDSGF